MDIYFILKILSVFNTSSFGNCLTDLSVSELLVLKHSLDNLSVKEDIVENRYLKPDEIQCSESAEGSCLKPSSMALVAEDRYEFTKTFKLV